MIPHIITPLLNNTYTVQSVRHTQLSLFWISRYFYLQISLKVALARPAAFVLLNSNHQVKKVNRPNSGFGLEWVHQPWYIVFRRLPCCFLYKNVLFQTSKTRQAYKSLIISDNPLVVVSMQIGWTQSGSERHKQLISKAKQRIFVCSVNIRQFFKLSCCDFKKQMLGSLFCNGSAKM